MYQDFSVTTIIPSWQDNAVYINFSMEVHPDTINDVNIRLTDGATGSQLGCSFEISGRVVKMILDTFPTLNIEYILSVNRQVKNVLGDSLSSSAQKRVVFKPEITSKLKITYPAYDEVIKNLAVKWEEILQEPNVNPIGSYYIEISTDVLFYNIVKKTTVFTATEIDISDVPNNQYYVRGRVEKDGRYGVWSEVITFIVGDEPSLPGPIVDPGVHDPDDSPIYDSGVRILVSPEQGETPESFIIEFDKEIKLPEEPYDIDTLKAFLGIKIARRLV